MYKRNHYKKRPTGYRSGLEERMADHLGVLGVNFQYESVVIPYLKPQKPSRYTPDFLLSNGIFIETKGLFGAADRAKHLLVREQNPQYDIRFIFQRSSQKLYKGSKTSYADWCNANGFRWAEGGIPKSWLSEKPKPWVKELTVSAKSRKVEA